MPRCECGAHVSKDYARVFGVDGRVPKCITCAGYGAYSPDIVATDGGQP